MMKQCAPYEWWTRALNGEEIGGENLPIYDGYPQEGFYRVKSKAGQPRPVAIFQHEGKMVAKVMEDLRDAAEVWIWACRNPVTEEAYRHALATGEWADTNALAAPRTGNQTLAEKIEEATQGQIAQIVDDDSAAAAQTMRSCLLALAREADAKRKALKEPFLEGGKEIDREWMPLVKKADDAAGKISRALSSWLTAKAQAHKENRINEPEPTTVKGGIGRAATVRIVNVVTGISDIDALFGYLRDNPDFRSDMQAYAQRAVSAGHKVPGVTTEEQRKVS